MAAAALHLRKAEYNELFLKNTDFGGNHLDWAATIIFYSALHYLRAFFAREGFPNADSYQAIETLFASLPMLQRNLPLWFAYRELKDQSWEARYRFKEFTREEIQLLRTNHLHKIRTFVLEALP